MKKFILIGFGFFLVGCNDLNASFKSSDVINSEEFIKHYESCVSGRYNTKYITGREFGPCLVTAYNLSKS